ncbi:MAG: DUF2188 domain-containing protein [bacterium]|nr:DUF2188 domain-containing protein [bacterium]
MPWTETDYPVSLKNFEPEVRNKAVEIANALLEEGYEEGRAIAIATAQAKKWAERHDQDDDDNDDVARLHDPAGRHLHVVPHPKGWAVQHDNTIGSSYVSSTRGEALEKAVEMARNERKWVILHDDQGQIVTQLLPEDFDQQRNVLLGSG